MPSASGFPTSVLVTGSQEQEGGMLAGPSHCPPITQAMNSGTNGVVTVTWAGLFSPVASYWSSGF